MTHYPFQPDYAVPPGETIREVAKDLQIGPRELRRRLGLSRWYTKRLLCGDWPITPEIARRLPGWPAACWERLDGNYSKQLRRLEAHP